MAAGDVVRVWMDRPGSAKKRAARSALPSGEVEVLYEDDLLMVLNKPAGLLAVPLERRSQAASVSDHIEDHLPTRAASGGRSSCTGSIAIPPGWSSLPRIRRTQQHLRAQFKRREPERVYRAVVYGHPSPPSGTWRDQLVWDTRALIQKETHPRDPAGEGGDLRLPCARDGLRGAR